MKKLFVTLLAAMLLLSLCACTEKTPVQKVPDPADPGEPAATSVLTEPEKEEPSVPAVPTDPTGETEKQQIPEETVPAEPETPAPEQQPEPTVSEPDAYWYDMIAEDLSWQAEEREERVSVRIPAFADCYEASEELNNRIEEDTADFLFDIQEAKESGYSSVCEGILYEAWLNGNVVSLLTDVRLPNDVHLFYAYNLDISTGKELSGSDLLELYGYSEETFVTTAQSAASDYFKSCYGELMDDPFTREQYDKTMSADGYGTFLPIFLGEDGALGFVLPVYSVAGADSYQTVFYLNG